MPNRGIRQCPKCGLVTNALRRHMEAEHPGPKRVKAGNLERRPPGGFRRRRESARQV